MSTCTRSHSALPPNFNYCPICGARIPRLKLSPDTEVNQDLLVLAKKCQMDDYAQFYFEVMKLTPKIAYALVRSRITPAAIVTMKREELMEIRQIGHLAAETIIKNRLSYKK